MQFSDPEMNALLNSLIHAERRCHASLYHEDLDYHTENSRFNESKDRFIRYVEEKLKEK